MRKIPFHKSIIAVDVYDPILPEHWTAEWESWESIEILRDTLVELGHEVKIISEDTNLIQVLSEIPDSEVDKTIVWNLVEGFQSRNRESYVPSLCEFYGMAHTGSDAYAQCITLDKKLTKKIARSINIPVIQDFSITEFGNHGKLSKKYFIKPRFEGSSLGVVEASIIEKPSDLNRYLIGMKTSGIQDFMIEEFLEGPDLTIGLFFSKDAIQVTKLGKIIHNGSIYSQSVKSKYGEFETISYDGISENLERQVQEYSKLIAQEIGLSGYSRIDWKLNAEGLPFFLEINATPGLSPLYSLLPILYKDTFHKSYSELIKEILENSYYEFQNNKRFQYGKRKHNVF
jgi:D-alanine-D-alanine ligase